MREYVDVGVIKGCQESFFLLEFKKIAIIKKSEILKYLQKFNKTPLKKKNIIFNTIECKLLQNHLISV